MDKPDWKGMAAQSSRVAALREAQCLQLVEAGERLLATLPPHWHDDAVVEFRDLVADVKKSRALAGVTPS